MDHERKQVTFAGLSGERLQVKGCGFNLIYEVVTKSRIPGSFLITENKGTSQMRLYCLIDTDGTWSFSLSPVNKSVTPVMFGHYLAYDPDNVVLTLCVSDDVVIQPEGEFNE